MTDLNQKVTLEDVTKPIIIFGEVLVDAFGDQTEVIGGAPLNVAWNLRAIECHPRLVSAIGSDDTGKRILSAIESWRLPTEFIQVDPDRPTGRVLVRHERGEPTYEIPRDQAFDFIRYPNSLVVSFTEATKPILYHGSLCARSTLSLETLLRLRRQFESNIAIDVNLRSGQYETELIQQLIDGVAVLKCNLAELCHLTGQSFASRTEAIEEAATFVARTSTLREFWVTDGGNGAFVVDDTGQHYVSDAVALPDDQVVDTVGAGDAFMAAVLYGHATETPLPITLDLAVRMAANVCKIEGATTTDESRYAGLLQSLQ
ncbi:MAG: PfkB family carbohydrate kinase [Planctomycetota bacterium]